MVTDQGKDPERGHYEFDLDCQVETCIQEYEEALEAWWTAGGPTDQTLSQVLLEQAKRFADTVRRSTDGLVQAGKPECPLVEPEFQQFVGHIESRLAKLGAIIERTGVSAEQFLALLRDTESDIRPDDGTLLKVVWEILLAENMWEAVARSRKAATRLLSLASLRIPSKPTKVTRSFLRQAGECFVWGFDAPCIVFCRSVIDVALKDAGIRRGTLEQRICDAPGDILDQDGKKDAHHVRKLGNDAVHDKPLAMDDVLNAVRKTLLVLQQITNAKPL